LNQKLPQETIKLLWRIYRQSQKYQVRQRAHCIILMEEGYAIEELIKIFSVSRKTIYNWKNSWLNKRLVGLYNRPGTGRKEIFNDEQKAQIKQWAKFHNKNLKPIIELIKKKWKIEVSRDTVKRILKCLGMKWKRLKKIVAGKPEPELYERKKKILEALKKLSDQGTLDLRYLDETGFCLTPYVPYAWQDKEEKQGQKSQPSKRLNVLGLLNRNNELESYIFQCQINSEIVIKFIDKYSEKIDKLTVVVIDNAPIHTSKAFKEKIAQWRQKKLEIFWLPTYSPQLNLIEILWRFMKYTWIETEAYSSWGNLTESVERILQNFGDRYVINFA
jgi:transposase